MLLALATSGEPPGGRSNPYAPLLSGRAIYKLLVPGSVKRG
jgi:hypothetical protein